MKRRIMLVLLMALLLMLTAAAQAQRDGRIFVDSLGREVTVPQEITRVAVSGQMAQMAVFALAPDRLVGIANEWDPSAEQFLDAEYYHLPLLGQLYGGKGQMNLETLLKAEAQVVIDVGEPKESAADDLDVLSAQTGIPFVHISAYIDGMDETYKRLGELLGMEEEAAVLSRYCADVYQRTQQLMSSVEKANLLYVTGEAGLNVIARDSYQSAVIDMMSNNLAVLEHPTARGTGNEVDMEQILNWNPAVVIFSTESIYADVTNDPLWGSVAAIQNGTYYEVPFGLENWMGFPPGVQRLLGMLWLGKALYPDAAQYDLYAEAARYYELFYHCRLPQEQYDELVKNSIGR